MPGLYRNWRSRRERDDCTKSPVVRARSRDHHYRPTFDHLRRHKSALKITNENVSGLNVIYIFRQGYTVDKQKPPWIGGFLTDAHQSLRSP